MKLSLFLPVAVLGLGMAGTHPLAATPIVYDFRGFDNLANSQTFTYTASDFITARTVIPTSSPSLICDFCTQVIFDSPFAVIFFTDSRTEAVTRYIFPGPAFQTPGRFFTIIGSPLGVLTVTDVTAVPEPSSLFLASASLLISFVGKARGWAS